MAYRFRRNDTSVEKAVRRIAREELRCAIASLERPDDLHEGVHEARKAVKRLRGLLRLVRPVMQGYGKENRRLRDAARGLAGLRSPGAAVETIDRLLSGDPGLEREPAVAALRARLVARRDEAEHDPALPDRIRAFHDALGESLTRLDHWRLRETGFDALAPGLEATRGAAAEAMRKAAETGRPEDFHEWRKQVKYHGYHIRLLSTVWPTVLKPHARAIDVLGEKLGQHHDLTVFAGLLENGGTTLSIRTEAERAALEAEALMTGAELFAEPPGEMAGHLRALWKAWRKG